MQLIGQTRVRSQLRDMTTAPKFILLVGSKGSGRRTLANWLVNEFGHDSEIVTDMKVDDIRAVIESSLTLSRPKTYIFPDAQEMNLQAQNASLKTLEEASANAFYIWTVNSELNVLPTIRSRARVLRMDGYSRDELGAFTEDEELLDMCWTPGQILRYEAFDWRALRAHCEKVVDNIGRLNVANVFNILKTVKDDQYDLVIPMMSFAYWKKFKDTGVANVQLLKILQDTSVLLDRSVSVNVRNALETMLLRLWEAS